MSSYVTKSSIAEYAAERDYGSSNESPDSNLGIKLPYTISEPRGPSREADMSVRSSEFLGTGSKPTPTALYAAEQDYNGTPKNAEEDDSPGSRLGITLPYTVSENQNWDHSRTPERTRTPGRSRTPERTRTLERTRTPERNRPRLSTLYQDDGPVFEYNARDRYWFFEPKRYRIPGPDIEFGIEFTNG